MSTSTSTLHLINVVAYALNVAITYGVGVGGLFGLSTNTEVSRRYQTLVTPAGWAFSIWGIIFLAQLAWVVSQFFSKSGSVGEVAVKDVAYGYLYVCLAQAGWTFAFGNEIIWLSMVFMTLVLYFLWTIVLALGPLSLQEDFTALDYLLWKFPFTIHAGWITAATFVNANVLLVSYQASASLLVYAAVISLASLLIIALFTPDLVIPLVVAWGLLGIYFELQHPDDAILEKFSFAQRNVAQTGALAIAGVILFKSVIKICMPLLRRFRTITSHEGQEEEAVYLRADD